MRPPGGMVRPAGATRPGQWNARPPEMMSGSPKMQSSEPELISSNPCVVGWKMGASPKSTVVEGLTVTWQGRSCRPRAVIGTSMDGCRPSFDSITSEAFSCRAWLGVKRAVSTPWLPGWPMVQGRGGVLNDHTAGSPLSVTRWMTSGARPVGSRPTLVRKSFLGRVVPNRGGLEIERIGPRVDHRAVAGAYQVEIVRRSLGGEEARVPLLRAELGRREPRGARDGLAGGERQREDWVPGELHRVVAGGDHQAGHHQGPLAVVARGERDLLGGAQPDQAEIDAGRLHVEQADDSVAREHERQRAAGRAGRDLHRRLRRPEARSEEHTSELQ